jgi:hypothetical protein
MRDFFVKDVAKMMRNPKRKCERELLRKRQKQKVHKLYQVHNKS